MGHFANDAGKAWEQTVDRRLAMLKHTGVVAWYEHQQPELYSLGMVRRGGRMIQAFGKGAPSGADFSGALVGRTAFGVEAKSKGPKEGADPILILEDDVSDRQREHMDTLARAGHLAVLAVQFRLERDPWVLAAIPWLEVPWEVPRSRHVLRHTAALPWRIPTEVHLFEHLLIEKK